jgi:hypothetical protein
MIPTSKSAFIERRANLRLPCAARDISAQAHTGTKPVAL